MLLNPLLEGLLFPAGHRDTLVLKDVCIHLPHLRIDLQQRPKPSAAWTERHIDLRLGMSAESYRDLLWPGNCRKSAAKVDPISVDFPCPFSPRMAISPGPVCRSLLQPL